MDMEQKKVICDAIYTAHKIAFEQNASLEVVRLLQKAYEAVAFSYDNSSAKIAK